MIECMTYPKYTRQRTGSNFAFSGYSWKALMTKVPLLNAGQALNVGRDEATPTNNAVMALKPPHEGFVMPVTLIWNSDG